jgi:phosphatidylglycerol---prolipoprotein diacylglyceryl transferase
LIYTRKKNLQFLTWANIIVPGVALAQGIGRWGNFFNQEIYGLPTKITQFPISVFIDAQGGYFLATFFYEFVWNLINMCLLLWLPRKLGDKMKPGDNFLVYAIFYAVGRFFLEFIRYVDSPILGQNSNQIVMAVIAIAATGILIFRHLKKTGTKDNPGEEPII